MPEDPFDSVEAAIDDIIAGKLLPFALIGLVNVFTVTGIAVAWFAPKTPRIAPRYLM